MKIVTTDVIKNLDGTPVKDKDEELTFFHIFSGALNIFDERTTPEDKAKMFNLNLRIHQEKGKEMKLTVEEAKLLKDCVGKSYSPVIVGRVNELLDGTEE